MTTFAEGSSALSGAFQTLLERCEAKEQPLCYERHHAGYHGPVRGCEDCQRDLERDSRRLADLENRANSY